MQRQQEKGNQKEKDRLLVPMQEILDPPPASYFTPTPQMFAPSYPTTGALQAATQPYAQPAKVEIHDEHYAAAYRGLNSCVIASNDDLANLKIPDVVQKSTLTHADPQQVIRNIVSEFNRGNPEVFTVESSIFGRRIDANQFMLVHKNLTPQLIAPIDSRVRLGIYLLDTIQFIGMFDQKQLVVGAHGRFVVNVPQGKLIKVWYGTDQAVLLGPGPHVIRQPNFKLDPHPEVNISDEYIQHGNIHIVRVPRGKLAKINIGKTPYLLESNPEPYVIKDPTFALVPCIDENGRESNFVNASNRLIEHGSIKRVLPRNEVAVAYNHGKLQIITPADKPIVEDNPSFFVEGFLDTVAQTLVFPSEKAKLERQRENPRDTNAINFEKFRTKEGLEVGVKLLVVYEVTNPKTTLSRLKKDGIVDHIENIVVADMNSVIQNCSSADFQKTNQTTVKDPKAPNFDTPMFNESAPLMIELQDKVKNKLAEDLEKWGINLVRVNIEKLEILSVGIAEAISKNAIDTTKKLAEASTLSLEAQITRQHAEQDAEKMRIQMEREKENKILAAKGTADAKLIEAQGILSAAETKARADQIAFDTANGIERAKIETAQKKGQAENDVYISRIKAENDAKLELMRRELELQNAALEKRADIYAKNESFRTLELGKTQAETLRGVATTVISPEVAQSLYGSALGFGLFQRPAGSIVPFPGVAKDQKEQDKVPELTQRKI